MEDKGEFAEPSTGKAGFRNGGAIYNVYIQWPGGCAPGKIVAVYFVFITFLFTLLPFSFLI